jgi:predicted dehydrogenase
MNRRTFLHQTSALAAAPLSQNSVRRMRRRKSSRWPSSRWVVAWGMCRRLLKIPNVEIAYLAEVDPKRLESGLKVVNATQQVSCQGVKDFRSFLDDKTLDAVFIATPNFWHTPAALLCMQAGKHVYVEKPGSQNAHEAEMIVAAANKYDRVVQMGNQRRTWMKDAITALHEGAIGPVRFGRGFYYNSRKSVAVNEKPAASGSRLRFVAGTGAG